METDATFCQLLIPHCLCQKLFMVLFYWEPSVAGPHIPRAHFKSCSVSYGICYMDLEIFGFTPFQARALWRQPCV